MVEGVGRVRRRVGRRTGGDYCAQISPNGKPYIFDSILNAYYSYEFAVKTSFLHFTPPLLLTFVYRAFPCKT